MNKKSDQELDRSEVAQRLDVSVRHTYNLQKNGYLSKGRKFSRRGDRCWTIQEIDELVARLDKELEDQ